MALRSTPLATGHDLLAEFQETVSDIASRASERQQVVDARLAQLESERSTLSILSGQVRQVLTAAPVN